MAAMSDEEHIHENLPVDVNEITLEEVRRRANRILECNPSTRLSYDQVGIRLL